MSTVFRVGNVQDFTFRYNLGGYDVSNAGLRIQLKVQKVGSSSHYDPQHTHKYTSRYDVDNLYTWTRKRVRSQKGLAVVSYTRGREAIGNHLNRVHN